MATFRIWTFYLKIRITTFKHLSIEAQVPMNVDNVCIFSLQDKFIACPLISRAFIYKGLMENCCCCGCCVWIDELSKTRISYEVS